MCVRTIVDASAFRHFCAPTRNSAGYQLRRWIERGDGVVVYSLAGSKYAEELDRNSVVLGTLLDYYNRGRAIDIDSTCIKAAKEEIPDRPIRKSNDPHILALAVASEATVLFSCDSDLREDFGKVLRKVGRQHRSCVPGLRDEMPEDIADASHRRKFLENRKCPSPRC